MSKEKKLAYMLLIMRLSLFLVMILWTFDKFLNPARAAKVFETFYFMKPFGPKMAYAIASLQFIIVIAFALGYKKRISYGLVFLIQTVILASYYAHFMAPFQGINLLFFVAWPMWASSAALYVLRDSDNLAALE